MLSSRPFPANKAASMFSLRYSQYSSKSSSGTICLITFTICSPTSSRNSFSKNSNINKSNSQLQSAFLLKQTSSCPTSSRDSIHFTLQKVIRFKAWRCPLVLDSCIVTARKVQFGRISLSWYRSECGLKYKKLRTYLIIFTENWRCVRTSKETLPKKINRKSSNNLRSTIKASSIYLQFTLEI